MIFTREEVFLTCKKHAVLFQFEPELIQAICLQEGGRNDDGAFAPDVARLEQGFYRKYVEEQQFLATTSEILLAASYGVMQVMGLELKNLDYLDFYFNQCPEGLKKILKAPISQFAVPSAIDAFCENLDWQIIYGCKLLKKKLKIAGGNLDKAIDYYNGDLSGKYRAKIIAKKNALKK